MSSFLYNFFHNETRDRTEKGLVYIPPDKDMWPESWKKIFYKKYIFFKPILLPRIKGTLLDDILPKRRSNGEKVIDNKPTLPVLSYILQCGYGLQDGGTIPGREENRTVPSAGKRYPLELYVLLFREVPGCRPGVYHYGVKDHSLEPVLLGEIPPEEIALFSPQQKWLHGTAGMICITGVFGRTVNKYGSRGYRYTLLEAGHAAQNILLAGTEKGMHFIPIGGVEEAEIEKKLGLNSSHEKVVYALFF